MSYKSNIKSKPSLQNRKISFNLLQTHTRDSSEQATSSKSLQSDWQKDAWSIQTQSQSKVIKKNQAHMLAINLYNRKLEVDCSDVTSVRQFVDELDETDSTREETKMALLLIIAQKMQELKINCGDFLKDVLESYQTLHMHKIFN